MRSSLLLCMCVTAAWAAGPPKQDAFWRLSEINKASLVTLAEIEVVPTPLAAKIARGIRTVIDQESRAGAKRSGDYLQFEAMLTEASGSDASPLAHRP